MPDQPLLPLAHASRYVAPLREGGSLPALVETESGELVVAKWRGAGQGLPALVAEVIVGELARALGLPMPRLSQLVLNEALAKTERDQEIRELLLASLGTNLGMAYLSGALAFDPAAGMPLDEDLAARIVMFDAYAMNVDRTARNTNLLWWEDGLWLIDHGAALYWHHGWDGAIEGADRPFSLVRQHVLLPQTSTDSLRRAADDMIARLHDEILDAVVAAVPGDWLETDDIAARRQAYVDFLRARRQAPAPFVEEALRARAGL